jgi:hypothetical protein
MAYGVGLALCITNHSKPVGHRTGKPINASTGLSTGGTTTDFV